MRHLEGRKVRWASGDKGDGRQQQLEHGMRRRKQKKKKKEEEERRRKENTNLDNLVLELMAIVGCCGTLTALRGPASTINTVSDINNNT